MNVVLLIVMVLLLVAALERAHRRQPPRPPGLSGSGSLSGSGRGDHSQAHDRDWARTELDLRALGGPAAAAHEPPTVRRRPRVRWASRRRHAPKGA